MKHIIKYFLESFPTIKLWFSMPAFTGWLSLSFGIALAYKLPYTPKLYNDNISYAILLSLLFPFICKNSKIRTLLFILSGFLLFSFTIQKEQFFFKKVTIVINTNGNESVSGRVISTPLFSKQKFNFLLAADILCSDADTVNLHGKVLKCTSINPPPSYGTVICTGRFNKPKKPSNPYTFNEYSYLLANRIWGRFDVDSLIITSHSINFFAKISISTRATVIKTISHVKDANIQGILQAAFLGEKNNLTNYTKNLFKDAGIYHLLAISGLHVAILISSMLVILAIFPVPRVIKIVITILFIWCYLFFIGFIPSLFRAVVMATIILSSFIFQKNSYTINSLGVAGILWLVMSPASLFTPGYQLSFAATFGIITLFPLFSTKLIPQLGSDVLQLMVKTFLCPFFVSLSGFIATVPVLAYHFGRISLFGLIANIFSVFLMALAMNAFFIGIITQLIWAPISIMIMHITELFLSLMIMIAASSRFFPLASIQVPVPYTEIFIIYCILFLGFATINKKYLLKYIAWVFPILFLASPLIISCHNLSNYSEITFFSTKKGSLAGIRFPNKKIWLISSLSEGSFNRSYENVIEPWLRHFMIKKVDVLLLPFAGQNVVHDLDPILAHNKPEYVITCNKPEDKILNENFHSFLKNYMVDYIEAKDGWRIVPAKQCTCTVYNQESTIKWYENNMPAIIKFSFGDTQLLINATNKVVSGINPKNAVIRINKDISIFTGQGIKKKYLDTQNTNSSYSTEVDGAVTVKIKKYGRYRVYTGLGDYSSLSL